MRAGVIEIYDGRGVRLRDRDAVSIGRPPDSGGERGTIRGWSMASRRRLREALLSHVGPDGWSCYGVTLTVPGSPLSGEQVRDVWGRCCRSLVKWNLCGVWRLEIQERGSAHWHLIVWCPESSSDLWLRLREIWLRLLDSLGPDRYETAKGRILDVDCRSSCPDAGSRAVSVEEGSECVGAWLRYLADHASKSKQGQIADMPGCRHWGIIGRGRLVSLYPDDCCELSEAARSRYIRAVARLARPRIPDPRCVFGSRLGYKRLRGGRGSSVWFTRTETARRLVAWASGAS